MINIFPYSISEIHKIVEGKAIIINDLVVNSICIDSRRALNPQFTLFVAIKTKKNDGHKYIREMYEKQCRTFLISDDNVDKYTFPDANFIIVDDTIEALQKWAGYHRKKFKYPVIAITGSNGKTIVKEWIYHCLSEVFSIVRSPASFNSQIGVPISLLLLNDSYNLAVFEAGISMPYEMDNLEKIILPNIGIITNIGLAHQENFLTTEDKILEKLKLFKNCNTIIYCRDHLDINDKILQLYSDKNLVTWGMHKDSLITINNVKKNSNYTEISLNTNNKNYKIIIPFVDDASIVNAVHVFAVAYSLNSINDNVLEKFKSLPSIALRLEQRKGKNNCTIINDSYNSDINSLAIALDVLKLQKQHTKKTLILSDIIQSGINESVLYERVSNIIKNSSIKRFFGIGKNLKKYKDYFNFCESYFFESANDFLKDLFKFSFFNEAILIKGARIFELDKIADALEFSKHSTRLEINLSALISNFSFYKSLLNKETKIMAMVKAMGYGSGSYEIASVLQYQGVDYLGVAFVDEGIHLRKNGITLPIMVMNPEIDAYNEMIKYDLEPEIYNFRSLEKFYEIIRKNQITSYPIHIKLDTGMHRLGFMKDDIENLCQYLKNSPEIAIVSVFSHLAVADMPEYDYYTELQIKDFIEMTDYIEKSLKKKFIRHILNTAGIERFPQYQFDMVRLGIGLYGFSSYNQHKLKNVSTLKTTISQIKKIKKGEAIGYGRTYIAQKEMTIGIIPIGYADGLNRRLSNKGYVIVNNKKARIIGNICMDMCMIDITDIEAKEGDDVIVFGENLPVTHLANMLDTIPYEIFTSVSNRVKRIYYHE